MKSLMLLVFSLVLLFGTVSYARCFPESTRMNPMTSKSGGITEKQFNEQLDILEKAYAPEIKAMGYNLVIHRLWSDGTINSDTTVNGKNWEINSYGGLARYKQGGVEMTTSGYLAVACHELGHHMGGAPRYDAGANWASNEGESDYWATLVCMKRLDPTHADAAAQNLADVLSSLEGAAIPSAATPDTSIVTEMYDDHPGAQCRFDTYFAGLACPVNAGLMDPIDPSKSGCYSYPAPDKYDAGSRPRCWFFPAP